MPWVNNCSDQLGTQMGSTTKVKAIKNLLEKKKRYARPNLATFPIALSTNILSASQKVALM